MKDIINFEGQMTEAAIKADVAPAKVEEKKKEKTQEKPKEKAVKKPKTEKKMISEKEKQAVKKEKKLAAKEKKVVNFLIDCSLPVKDKVFQAAELVEYFTNKLKVEGKTKNFGKQVTVGCDDGKKIKVNAEIPLAKRYLKYLAKKFLKKQEVRDYLRLVAPNKTGYEFKYFKMESNE